MRPRLYVLLGSSILLTGCPMGGASSSLDAPKTATATSSGSAVAELAHAREKDEPAAKDKPIIVRRERGSPLEVHADKLKTSDDGGALAATIVSKGETIAKDVPLGEISGVALEPNTTYVVKVEDVSDSAQPEPVEQITVVTPARQPEIVSVEPLGGDRILVEVDLRDNPPGTSIALGAASSGASEPDLLLDPRTGAPLPAGAEPFVDPSASATMDTPVEEQVAEAATVGVELGATVGVSGSSDGGLGDGGLGGGGLGDGSLGDGSLGDGSLGDGSLGDGGLGDGGLGDGGAAASVASIGSGEGSGSGPGAESGDDLGSGSTLLVVVSLPSGGGDVGMAVQAQNDQGVATGWSEPMPPASPQAEPEILDEHAEDTQDEAVASAALEELSEIGGEETAGAPTTAPAADASPTAMIAWLGVRVEAVRQELRAARTALAASRHDLKAARADLLAAKQELARLQQSSRRQKKGLPDVAPEILAAARDAVGAAQGVVDEFERGIAEQRRRRKALRTSLAELIDELQTRRAAAP